MSLKKDIFIFLNSVIKGIKKIKGKEIIVLDLSENKRSICSYFVLNTENSSTQVVAIGKNIEKESFKKLKEKPYFVKGISYAYWVVMDYINVVIHIFQKETRNFYNLEKFWEKEKKIDLTNFNKDTLE